MQGSKKKIITPLGAAATGDDLSTKTEDTTSVSIGWIVLLFSVKHNKINKSE